MFGMNSSAIITVGVDSLVALVSVSSRAQAPLHEKVPDGGGLYTRIPEKLSRYGSIPT